MMWDHLPVHNLIGLQLATKVKQLDRQITADYEAGYMADVDRLLDERALIVDRLREGPAAFMRPTLSAP